MSVVAKVLLPLAGRASVRTACRVPESVPLGVPRPHLPDHFPPLHFPTKPHQFNLPPPYYSLPRPKHYSPWQQVSLKQAPPSVHQDPLFVNLHRDFFLW